MSKPQIFLKGNKTNLFKCIDSSDESVLVTINNHNVKINFLKCATVIISGDLSEYSIELDGELTGSLIINRNVKINSIYTAKRNGEINLEFEGQNTIGQILNKINYFTVVDGCTEIRSSSENEIFTQVREFNVKSKATLNLSNAKLMYINDLINNGNINLNASIIKNNGKSNFLNHHHVSLENRSELQANDLTNNSVINSSRSKVEAISSILTQKGSEFTIKNSCFDVGNFSLNGEFKSADSKIKIKTLHNLGLMEIQNAFAEDDVNIFEISEELHTYNKSYLRMINVTSIISDIPNSAGNLSLSNTSLTIKGYFDLGGLLHIKDKSYFKVMKTFFNSGCLEVNSSQVYIDELVDFLDKSRTNHLTLNNEAKITINKCNDINTTLNLHNDSEFEIKESDVRISSVNVLNIIDSRIIFRKLTNGGVINLKKGIISSFQNLYNAAGAKIVGHGDILSSDGVYNEGSIVSKESSPINIIAKNFLSCGDINAVQIMLNIAYEAKMTGIVNAKVFGANIEGEITFDLKKCQIDRSYVKSGKIFIKSFIPLYGENNHIWHGKFDEKFGHKNIPKQISEKFKVLNTLGHNKIDFAKVFNLGSDAVSNQLITYLEGPKEWSLIYSIGRSISDNKHKIIPLSALALSLAPYIMSVTTTSAASLSASGIRSVLGELYGKISLNTLTGGLSILHSFRNDAPLDREINNNNYHMIKDVCKKQLTSDNIKGYFVSEDTRENVLNFLHNEIPAFLCNKPQSNVIQLINSLYRYSDDMPRCLLELLRFLQKANIDKTNNLRVDYNANTLLNGYNNNLKLLTPSYMNISENSDMAHGADNDSVKSDKYVSIFSNLTM